MKLLFVVLLLAILLVGWVGWEIEAHRDDAEHTHRERKRNPLQSALESHLAIWLFMLVLAWVGFRLGSIATWPFILVLGAVVAVFVWSIGRRVGAGRRFPGAIRWLLAPLHGVSLWLVFLATAVRRRTRPRVAGSPAEEGGVESIRQGVFELDALTLTEVLVPRSQIVALGGDDTVETALTLARKKPHTVYPVFGTSVDQPLGVVRLTDLTRPGAWERPVREFAIVVPIVPETMTGVSLLERLAEAPIACALVVDEFGSLAGLVTMEDLVEVLVGELSGEHEIERKRILPLEPGSYRVEGVCEVEEFNEKVREVLPEGEYETVAGLFLDRVGRIPQQGDEIELPGASLEVLERTDRRVLWLKITLPSEDPSLEKAGT